MKKSNPNHVLYLIVVIILVINIIISVSVLTQTDIPYDNIYIQMYQVVAPDNSKMNYLCFLNPDYNPISCTATQMLNIISIFLSLLLVLLVFILSNQIKKYLIPLIIISTLLLISNFSLLVSTSFFIKDVQDLIKENVSNISFKKGYGFYLLIINVLLIMYPLYFLINLKNIKK